MTYASHDYKKLYDVYIYNLYNIFECVTWNIKIKLKNVYLFNKLIIIIIHNQIHLFRLKF